MRTGHASILEVNGDMQATNIDNTGRVFVNDGGNLVVENRLRNYGTGYIFVGRHGSLVAKSLDNYGTILALNPIDVADGLYNAGVYSLGGKFEQTLANQSYVSDGGVLRVPPNSSVQLHTGSFGGHGVVDGDVDSEINIHIGHADADRLKDLNISGDYNQASSGKLNVTVCGGANGCPPLGPSNEVHNSKLNVNKTAKLSGELHLTVGEDFSVSAFCGVLIHDVRFVLIRLL
jgi:hypothetical protein